MPNDRKRPAAIDFTEAELEMFGDFTDAERAGGNPDIGEFLKRCPGSEVKMRPILETAQRLGRLSAGFTRLNAQGGARQTAKK